jgi:hypothetical protein
MQETTNRSALDRIMERALKQDAERVGAREEGYNILRGRASNPDDSLEEQARRANHHMMRLMQADTLREQHLAELEQVREFAKGLITEADRLEGQLQWDFFKDTLPDRTLLEQWYLEAPQFNKPGRPRAKSIPVGLGRLRTATKTTPQQLVLANEAALAEKMPGYVKIERSFRWGDAKKMLEVADGKVITPDGEVLEPGVVTVLPLHSEQTLLAVVNGHELPLKGGDPHGDDGHDSGDEPGADDADDAGSDAETDDVFGDL